jgi:hemoglobin
MGRPSVYEYAGGTPAFLALAASHHQRCLDDPQLNHPFSHLGHPDHVARLGNYWGEVFGGPPLYAEAGGSHSVMLHLHAGQGMEDDLGDRFVQCFVLAADDAALPPDPELRATLRAYMQWAMDEIMTYNTADAVVEEQLPTPHWSWDGLQQQ